MVGMAGHFPEPLEYAEEKRWDLDFYMNCFYHPNKMKGKIDKKTGKPFQGEYYGDDDKERMCTFIKQTDKLCLGYKILAAGRNCATKEATKKAFEFALKNMKWSDNVKTDLSVTVHPFIEVMKRRAKQ